MVVGSKGGRKGETLLIVALVVRIRRYRTNDDFSAVGRLWKAVKNVEGCPDYGKFKRWVTEQQANDQAEKVRRYFPRFPHKLHEWEVGRRISSMDRASFLGLSNI